MKKPPYKKVFVIIPLTTYADKILQNFIDERTSEKDFDVCIMAGDVQRMNEFLQCLKD